MESTTTQANPGVLLTSPAPEASAAGVALQRPPRLLDDDYPVLIACDCLGEDDGLPVLTCMRRISLPTFVSGRLESGRERYERGANELFVCMECARTQFFPPLPWEQPEWEFRQEHPGFGAKQQEAA